MLLSAVQTNKNGRNMVRQRRTCGNSDVVHIYANSCTPGCVFGDDFLVDLVHHRLESSRGVAKAEEHDRGFEEAMACFKGRFVFVPFFDMHIVISPSYI